jgi:cytoskeletal protein CcmA (bactofilin family)
LNEHPQERESFTIDPVRMNILNRIAPGSRSAGTLECQGGLIVQGRFEGQLTVCGGPLVLMPEGALCGTIICDQDAYLAGTVELREDGSSSELQAKGAAFCSETLVAKANITAGAFKTYQGAQVEGVIKILTGQ